MLTVVLTSLCMTMAWKKSGLAMPLDLVFSMSLSQSSTQALQNTHLLTSMTASFFQRTPDSLRSAMEMQLTGQTFTHDPQPVQRSLMTNISLGILNELHLAQLGD